MGGAGCGWDQVLLQGLSKTRRRSLPLAAFVDCLGSRGLVELLDGEGHLFVRR